VRARAFIFAATVAGFVAGPATAQCRGKRDPGPALYVTAFAAHDPQVGRDVRDSIRAMVHRMVPPATLRFVLECDVENALTAEPSPLPSDSLLADDDLRELGRITHANTVIQFVIAVNLPGRVRFDATAIRPYERSAPIGQFYGGDLRTTELAAAKRIATDTILWRAPLRFQTPPIGMDQTFFEFQVEKQAMPVADNPRPVYPPNLLAARVEGEVLAQFTVDTNGRAEMDTFKILKSTHPLFTNAVHAVLIKDRFTAAEVSGRKVKQLVQMPFQFDPDRP